ncbi:MAG TPA: ABC transporter permease [Terriglobales bacterium]|nr:ABC transporter permease [Terriglobales bacterium]
MNSLLHDIRSALRQLRKNPGFTVIAICVMAFGIGASTGMLVIVQSVLIRPLKYPRSEQLMLVAVSGTRSNQLAIDVPVYRQMRTELSAFSGLAGYRSMPVPVETEDGTKMVFAPAVTPNFFQVLGVAAQNGRVFNEGERLEAVIGSDFWHTSLHSRKDAVGSTLKVGGHFYTIVGIMPAGFQFPQGGSLWTTLDLDAKDTITQGMESISVLGRLKNGVTPEIAEQEGESFIRRLPNLNSSEGKTHLWVYPYSRIVTADERPALLALLGACFVLLLIGVVNTANLQIARATYREAEMVTRTALGAGRGHIVRQILTESLILAVAGASFGWLLVSAMLQPARHWFAWLPRFDELRPDLGSFAVCAGLTLVCGIAMAIAPLLRLLHSAKQISLLHTTLGSSTSARQHRLSAVLVSAEIALTCILLVAATLFLRTFRELEHAPLGFEPANVVTFLLWPERPNSAVEQEQASFERVLDRLESMPGVHAAGLVTSVPLSNFAFEISGTFSIPGHVASDVKNTTRLSVSSPDYFKAMGIPILSGRSFLASDLPGTNLVGVVNQSFVRRYLPRANAVGEPVILDKYAKFPAPITIVGVSGDVIQGDNLGQAAAPEVMISYGQLPPSSPIAHMLLGIASGFAVQTDRTERSIASTIQAVVKQEAPGFALDSVSSLESDISDHLQTRRTALQLSSIFGALALLLSMAGVYGVLAYITGQRTREIGIRLALGATREKVMMFVLRIGAVAVVSGVIVGFAGALLACRWIRTFLYGVSAYDPLSYLLVAGVLIAASLGAILVPARRAAKVDPMVALRYE